MSDLTDPAVPPTDGTCHFLRLPQELRDEVYGYAITSSEDYVVCDKIAKKQILRFPGAKPTTNATESTIVVNQLQYVSKQLRSETLGFSFKLNKKVVIVSEDHKRKGPTQEDLVDLEDLEDHQTGVLQHSLDFLLACTPTSLSKLTTVVIQMEGVSRAPHGGILTWPLINGPLNAFCIANRHISVKIELLDWKSNWDAQFYVQGRTLTFFADTARASIPDVASNLRFVPAGSLDIEKLEEVRARAAPIQPPHWQVSLSNKMEKWFEGI